LESDKDRTEWLKFSLSHKDIYEDAELKADIVRYIVSGGKDGNFEKIGDEVLKRPSMAIPLATRKRIKYGISSCSTVRQTGAMAILFSPLKGGAL
jgi:hypothetical protein